jgi:biotin transport system substrate-specific component
MRNRELARLSIFAALIAVFGLMPRLDIPFAAGVPITAQTLGVMLAGLLLGPRLAAMSVALFLLVVACGAPLLSGGRGGLGVFAGPTAGYLVGWIFGAFVIGFLLVRIRMKSPFLAALSSSLVGGILVIHLIGAPWLAWAAGLTLPQAFLASATFLPGDMLKAIAAAYVYRLHHARVSRSERNA